MTMPRRGGALRRRGKPRRRFAVHPAVPARGVLVADAVAALVLQRLRARQRPR